MQTRIVMFLFLFLSFATFLLSRGFMESVYRHEGFAPFGFVFALLISLYSVVLIFIMPFIGISAINEMPKDIRTCTFCITAYKWSYICFGLNFLLPLLFIGLSIFFTDYYDTRTQLELVFLCCCIISLLITNISQVIINILLFYKYRLTLQLFALITQILLCLTIYFADGIISRLSLP